MSLVNLSLHHGATPAEAEAQLAATAEDVRARFGRFVKDVEWSEDRRLVKFLGPGVWVEMRVDATHVHAEGDVPALSGLLGGSVKNLLGGVLKRQFPKALPEK